MSNLDGEASITPALPVSAVTEVSEEAAALNAQSQVLGTANGPHYEELKANQDKIHRGLERMADVIEEHADEVTGMWRRRASEDVLVASSPAWSSRQFEDHIPEVLEVLCVKLRLWPEILALHAWEQRTARAHSMHRWQQGYDVRSLTREWGHLNGCLIEALDQFWLDSTDADVRQALRVARTIVAAVILESTSESVAEYARLLQTEASARARHLETAIEALREEERSRGQVLRQAAHDLRGSLGIVSGSASLIDRSQMEPDDRAEVGRILRRGVHSLHEMMTELIDLARLEAGEEAMAERHFDVAQALRDLGQAVAPLAQVKELELVLQGPDELLVWGDPLKVRRIAQNLILNAIKYTSEGHVALAWAPDGEERWMLSISDTGPGLQHLPATSLAHDLIEATDTAREIEGRTEGEQIAPRTLSSAVADGASAPMDTNGTADDSQELRADSAVKGEGVGLSIVKRLCDLMGASLELATRSGEGSTFRVLFPRIPPRA